jgi:GNAT superfamily N-acetyltransferase
LSGPVQIRAAEPDDVALVFTLIGELAEYEKLSDQVRGSEELLASWLFGPDAAAEAVIAEIGAETAGFALYYRTFSTFESRPGIWLEDLFVRPEHRRSGAGRALLAHLAQLTVQRGFTRLEWAALDWNSLALGFYDGLGARVLEDWRVLRLDGVALERLASHPPRT